MLGLKLQPRYSSKLYWDSVIEVVLNDFLLRFDIESVSENQSHFGVRSYTRITYLTRQRRDNNVM